MTVHQKVCIAAIKAAAEVLRSARSLEHMVSNLPTNDEVVFTEEVDKAFIKDNGVRHKIIMLEDDIDELKTMLKLLDM